MSGLKTAHRADRAAPARRRRALRRQDDHRRAGVLDERPERALRLAGQRRRAGSHHRRLVVGLGVGGVERPLRLRARQRHRRLGARAGQPLRARRPQADAWARSASKRVLDLAPSFDTCGWFARDVPTFARVADVLLGVDRAPLPERIRLLAPADVWGLLAPEVIEAQRGPRDRIESVLGRAAPADVVLDELRRDVLELPLPARSRGLARRRRPDRPLHAAARRRREGSVRVGARSDRRAGRRRRARSARASAPISPRCSAATACSLMPTMPDVAPLASADEAGLEDYRNRATRLLCSAGLRGLSAALAAARLAPRRAARDLAARAGGKRPQPGAARRTDRHALVGRRPAHRRGSRFRNTTLPCDDRCHDCRPDRRRDEEAEGRRRRPALAPRPARRRAGQPAHPRRRPDADAQPRVPADRAAARDRASAGRSGSRRCRRYDARGPGWYWNNFSCGEHTGTHFDAPIHWISGKDLPNNSVDTIPVAALRRAGVRDRLQRAGRGRRRLPADGAGHRALRGGARPHRAQGRGC